MAAAPDHMAAEGVHGRAHPAVIGAHVAHVHRTVDVQRDHGIYAVQRPVADHGRGAADPVLVGVFFGGLEQQPHLAGNVLIV